MRPSTFQLPRHIAIIMDGNGRWATGRKLPRYAGHKTGVDTVETIVEAASDRGIEFLTLFAFSSENWRRPEEEVGLLMKLLLTALKGRIKRLHKQNVRLRIIGDTGALSSGLQQAIDEAESLTRDNTGLQLNIATNYGGQWDITQAVRQVVDAVSSGALDANQIDEHSLEPYLAFADSPNPDLFIRTGGERRISNFLLWQLAYTELFFTDTLWPDFDDAELDRAVEWFAGRQRRFGRVPDDVVADDLVGSS
ncbi:MAG TPA: isoprenyl transferase [Chromatiaceae bacterium]|nr:isoprenyl transferase [Chromatiaceae bacterium]HIO14559.1 isoprenyl transferase [Chromatiales bacterium]HIO53523.1 isoprenyl transferase [Chromatiales bacterium]